MRQKTLLLFFAAAVCAVFVYAYPHGLAYQNGQDATGASGGGGCGGGGCHGTTTSLGTTVELDTAGVPVTTYRPGQSYTVKIKATNSTSSTLPKFGFQLSAVKASGAGSNPVDAGTWGSTLPSNVRNTSTSWSGLGETIIEQSNAITATSGSGGSGTTYVESISWTAPAAGTGSVVIYGSLNAVNGNGSESGDKSQKATQITITEAVAAVQVAYVSIQQTSGTNPACSGSTLTFTAAPTNGGSTPTYQWLVNGQNAGSGSTFTSSTLNNGDVLSCVMTSNLSGVSGSPATSNTITLSINTPATPVVTASGSLLSSSSALAYQWYLDGNLISGATSQSYTATQNGNYTVTTTDGNGCTATSVGYLYSTTGIPQVTNSIAFKMYPSPNEGAFTIELPSDINSADMMLLDVNGKTVYQQKLEAGKQIIHTDLSTGMYVVKITTATETATQLVTINR
ncbi:MAG TPA: choice-of-anchor V domain-containing protein [Chitinophagales bacterium]|nr:choice-of-anchor V domain-containing protein [Chitinophagales bacterium]